MQDRNEIGLSELAGVSGECMDAVYEILRQCDAVHLRALWLECDPYVPFEGLLRHQIIYTIEKKLSGSW